MHRIPSDQIETIAKRLGVTKKDVVDMNRWFGGDASLNAPIREDSDSGEWQDWLVDEGASQETTLATRDEYDYRRKTLASALCVLNERERRIFEARRTAEDPITLVDLASEFGVSPERVRQIDVSSFEKIQKAVKNRVAAKDTPALRTSRGQYIRPSPAPCAGARAMGLQIKVHNADTRAEIDAPFEAMGRDRPDAVLAGTSVFLNGRRVQLTHLSTFYRLPTIYPLRDFVEVGGLISYGSDIIDSFRQAGRYVGRILKGAKPAELPILKAAKFELVINAQTARMLGLTVPSSLLGRADEIID
jgi:hypothetical protein